MDKNCHSVTSGCSELMCSINICGLSQRSHFMLNKYIYDKDIAVIGIQETGKVDKTQNRSLHNMKSFWDTNDQDI